MTPNEWAGLAVAAIAIITGFTGAIKWLVKHYFSELKPNGGGSMNDRLTRLETKMDTLIDNQQVIKIDVEVLKAKAG